MKTSKQWWEEVKKDEVKVTDWLQKQYVGEVTAAHRIVRLADAYKSTTKHWMVLAAIARDENIHASWVGELLTARGIELPATDKAEGRYWDKTLPGIDSLETGCAVGAHAEAMRLERIRVIAEDESAPEDIRAVFQKILPDEERHERMFRALTTDEAMERTRDNHELGLTALGLEH